MCCLLHKDLRTAQLPAIQGADQPPMSSPRHLTPGLAVNVIAEEHVGQNPQQPYQLLCVSCSFQYTNLSRTPQQKLSVVIVRSLCGCLLPVLWLTLWCLLCASSRTER